MNDMVKGAWQVAKKICAQNEVATESIKKVYF
jgi:hypothetical protein